MTAGSRKERRGPARSEDGGLGEPLEPSGPGSEPFEALFLREAPVVYAWAAARLGPSERSMAEDLVQEVWLRALNLFGGFQGPETGFRNWLLGIAQRTRLELLRQLVRHSGQPPGGFDLDRVPAEITSISSRLARDEELQIFVDRVSLLAPDELELLELRGFQELPWDEVARDLGLSPEAARQRYSRLLVKLRQEGLPRWLDELSRG